MSRRAPLAPHLGLPCAILVISLSVAAFSPIVHGAGLVADDLQKIASNGQAIVAVGNDMLRSLGFQYQSKKVIQIDVVPGCIQRAYEKRD